MALQLDERHHSILDATRHCLVLGGPGSGKTTLALLKAVRRIEEKLNAGQGVLFLSFSRAAVARIADAAKNQVPNWERGLLSIQTFHSFFWEILCSHGHLLGSPKKLSIVLAHDEKAMREGVERGDAGWDAWEDARQKLFHEEGRVCFDLFAPLAADLLIRAKRIRDRLTSRFPLILVDEAQDTSAEQWSCVNQLAAKSQVICLADLDQLIFDHLPGVGAERVDQIRTSLNPLEIDLGSDNNRSPGTEIAVFARDVLRGRVRGAPYNNVSRFRFQANADKRDRAIRQSVGILFRTIRETTGRDAESVGIIASYGGGVGIISAALRRKPEIAHQVLFDEAFIMLACRLGAFLLEPKHPGRRPDEIAMALDLLADAFRAKGGKTALKTATQLRLWAHKSRERKIPSVKLVAALNGLLETISESAYTGDPRKDWLRVKALLRTSGEGNLVTIAGAIDYLVAFNRGQRIAANLADRWMRFGTYIDAREALDEALTQEQLISGSDALKGVHVMNMHKCKGKQFDGVILYREPHGSPFVWKDDPSPHYKSRRVLHVAITRARCHVLILDEAYSSCPIIAPHTL